MENQVQFVQVGTFWYYLHRIGQVVVHQDSIDINLVLHAPSGARVMVVGCRGAVNINPRHLMLPEASIKGVALGTANADQYNEMGCAIVAGIEAGWIRPVIIIIIINFNLFL